MPVRIRIFAFAIAVTCGAWLAPAARGQVFHVSPNGSDAWPGTSPDSAWRTIAKANRAARPGDRIYVWPNPTLYADFPNPDSAGSNPTGGGFITFIGAHPDLDPLHELIARQEIRLPAGSLIKPYTSLKGLDFGGIVLLRGTAQRCSLSCSTIEGDLILDGCDYATISQCLGLGPRLSIAYVGTDSHTVACTVENCEFPQLGVGVHGGNHRFITGSSRRAKCDSLRFIRNHLTTLIDDIMDSHPRVHFWTQHSLFKYNRYEITTTTPGREFYAMRLRDSTSYNTFVCDTILMSGPALSILYWSSEGDSSDAWQRTVGNNTVDSCYINLLGSYNGSRMLFQQGMYGWTFRYNTLISGGRVFDATDVKQKNFIDHNTLVGDPWLGLVSFDKSETEPGFGDTLTFTNNILYATFPGIPGDLSTNYCAMFAHSQAFDSAGVQRLLSDHNLYTYYGYRYSPGDRSIRWDQGNYSGAGPGNTWSSFYGLDQHSRYGSPMFADSSVSLSFDAHLRPESMARGMASDGSDVGAVAYEGGPVAAAEPDPAPTPFALRAFPNPARAGLAVEFGLPRAGEARVRVLDVNGRVVRTLLDGPVAPGTHVVPWDGRLAGGAPARPGVYFLPLETGGERTAKRVALLR